MKNLIAMLLLAIATPCAARELEHVNVSVEGGRFQSDKPEEHIADISGIACSPRASHRDVLDCIVVDDELQTLQRAELAGAVLRPGAVLELPAPTPPAVFGRRPTQQADAPGCEDRDGRNSFDREAIVLANGYYYLIGSHGCSRNRNRFDSASFLVTRFRLNERGEAVDIQHSYRLVEALRGLTPVSDYFAKCLKPCRGQTVSEQGLNIEGAAIIDGVLYAGLRAPVLDGRVALVTARVDALFTNEQPLDATLRSVELNERVDIGVRDLAALPNGDLLVLAGPPEEESYPFGVYRVSPRGDVDHIGDLAYREHVEVKESGSESVRSKAEALFVIDGRGDRLRFLVLFDGPEDGGPRLYRTPAH